MNARVIFDDASAMNALANMKLLRELKTVNSDIASLGDGALAAMKRLKLAARAKQIRIELGGKDKAQTESEQAVEESADPVKKSASKRQKDNDAAIEALRKVKSGEADSKDHAIREALKGYSGSGGGLKTAQGTSGSPHEYYTPEPVAKAMWDLLDGLGFKGGKVLDPSSGMGVFARTKPESVAIEQIELDSVSGEINGLLNDSATVSIRVASFEEVAAGSDDETFDAVVTNVPFGDKAMRGAHWRKDKKYQNANLQEYFILRGLEKIRPGGFAAFIVPPSVVAGKGGKGVKLRNSVSMAAEFIGAYRLPNMVFDEAGADTITDIIILRKHGKENKLKIDELAQQNATILTEANVIWPDFVDGNYFKLEGKRFQIGETTTGKGRFGEVEKVAFTGTISSIAALLKPFPKSSRINWELLGAVETAPIIYSEGDTLFSGEAMLQMVDGKLVPVEGNLQNDDVDAINLMAQFTSPLDAINQGLTLENANRALENEETCGRLGSVPRWIISAQRAANAAVKNQGEWFEAIMAGMAVQEFAQAGDKESRNYAEAYPELSKALARVQGYSNKQAGIGGELVAEALQNIAVARKKGAFTAWWTGNIAKDEAVVLTVSQSYAKIKLDSEDDTGFVPAEEMRKAFADFDPLNDDQWCISPDGTGVMSAEDYYFGNYAEFLARAEQDMADATDPEIKEKLLRQHAKAKERITLVDPSRMRFSLETAFVSQEDKAEFVKQYVSADIVLVDGNDGKKTFKYNGSNPGSRDSSDAVRNIKTLRRFAIYLNNKTITTGTGDKAADDIQEEQALLDSIKGMVQSSSAQFDAWCKSNDDVVGSIRNKLNAPENLRFVETPNFSPVDIPNWNPAWVPHGYQFSAVRRFSKRFSGILGFDVGLGKTLSALATVQYAQSIGAKKKTIFVVPSSVLTKWKKETGKAYKDTGDCLFVGLTVDERGDAKYSSGSVDADLNVIRENRHSKIFMTYETLIRIPLREDTLQGYKNYLLANDDSFTKAVEEGANEKTRDVISAEQAVAAALESGKKSGSVPFFEDMGVDSLVVDECHSFKNSKSFSSEFKSTKFVANPNSSQRGMDMQAKCWYIRGITGSNDGIMALTATPVTNSPVEIYSMLSLAIGEKELNSMCGCTGADSFMMNTCDVENRDEDDLTGAPKNQRVLKGVANLDILRRVLDSAAMIETPVTVAAKGIIIEVPEAEEVMSKIEMSPEDTAILKDIKNDYIDAAAKKKAKAALSQREAIMASPFNAIRNMTKLITDKELYQGRFAFGFDPKEQAKAEYAVAAFNKLKITEECKEYELPFGIDTTGMKSKMVIDKESGNEAIVFYVPVMATIEGGRIILPAVDYKTHDRFIAIIDKASIGLTAQASPKTQALLANLKNENAHPRWKPAKQIVFCDELALHHKLKLLIAHETGIASSKISIVNAQSVSPDEIQGVQDGFNANEDENLYQIIIANKKAEVGIDLQDGTQAIHHLTIGWTPDSIHQRNGRGVRQGNKVETPVMIYHYEANGTFDAYKRRLVSVKGDWINSLMDKDSEHVTIEGDLSAEDYARMTSLVGDSNAMAQFNEDMAKKAKAQVADSAKIMQVNAISVAQGRKKWLDKYDGDQVGFTNWLRTKKSAMAALDSDVAKLQERLDKTESTDMAKRCATKIAELQRKHQAIADTIVGITMPSYGTVSADSAPDSVAVINWKKDVSINRKMLEEAQAACAMRATQGYNQETIAKLDSGDAMIVNGKILAEGDFVIADGVPGLINIKQGNYRESASLQFIYSSNGEIKAKPIAGMTINLHGTIGSDDRSEILKMLVELDETSIAAGKENLFARYSGDVRKALRTAITSLWIQTRKQFGADDDGWIVAPNFPLVMPDNAEGEFAAEILKAQQGIIEFKSINGWNHSFRFIDSRLQGESAGRTPWGAVAAWMVANGKTMTVTELDHLSGDGEFVREFSEAFVAGIPGMIEKSSNITEFDAAMTEWAKSTYPWLTELDDASKMEESFGLGRYVEKAKKKLDDGSVKYDFVVPSKELLQSTVSSELGTAIVKAFSDGAMNDDLMEFGKDGYKITINDVERHGSKELADALKQAFVDAVGGRLDGEYVDLTGSSFEEAVRSAVGAGKGAVLKIKPEDTIYPLAWIHQAVLACHAKRQQESLGIDVDGLLAAIQAHADVNTAAVSMKDYAKLADRFTGSFMYHAGKYIQVSMRYGSDLQKNISDKVVGLDGRVFDKTTKDWLVSLVPDKFSDGKPVADIAAFAKFVGIDANQFKKG